MFRFPDSPGGTITPEALTDANFPPGEWAAQLKYDGWRCHLDYDADADDLKLTSRHNKPVPVSPQFRMELQRHLSAMQSSVVLDTEWMGRRESHPEERLWIFDMLELDGTKLYQTPLAGRMHTLMSWLRYPSTINRGDPYIEALKALNGMLVMTHRHGFRDLFERSRHEPGCEGIVLKRWGSAYIGDVRQSAHNPAWFRCKWRAGEAGTTKVA